MAIPITAKAARACAKNSMLKQTDEDPKEKKVSSKISQGVIDTAGDFDIYGSGQEDTYETPGTPGTAGKPKKSLRQAYDDALKLGYRTKDESFEDYAKRAKADPQYGTSGSEGTEGTDPSQRKESDMTPDYETVKGGSAYDIQRDFRRQKKAERLAGKSEKQARRFANRAQRLTDRKKTEKAGIFERKSQMASQRGAQLRDRLKQFEVQQAQGGYGRDKYQTVKSRESGEAFKAREEARKQPNLMAGNDPTDFQNAAAGLNRLKEGAVSFATNAGNKIGDLLKKF